MLPNYIHSTVLEFEDTHSQQFHDSDSDLFSNHYASMLPFSSPKRS